jgi:hypothetical protein
VAEGVGIQGSAAAGVQANLSGTGSQAAEAATKLPQAPSAASTQPAPGASVSQATSYISEPAVGTQVHSKVVARLLQQNAVVHSPGLARVPLPPRPEDVPRTVPKKPAGPMVAPRDLDGGRSPLAPGSLWDARASISALGIVPTNTPGEA